MRQLTVVVPDLVSDPERDSALKPLPEALAQMVERGTVYKLHPFPPVSAPEVAWFALDPEQTQIAAGPLMVAALGHNPPSTSVHFHLTLCSVNAEDQLQPAQQSPTQKELATIFEAAEGLKTKTLTPLMGEALDHALVQEDGSLDMVTTPPEEAHGQAPGDNLPQGDGERQLRRFIDDSINLLSGLELNRIRRGEGQSALNCLWPWGQGFRPDVQNLALRRGDVVHVLSGSLRVAGIARLVGYEHGDRHRFRQGLQTDFKLLRRATAKNRLTLAAIETVAEMQRHGRTDEIAHNLELLSKEVLEPLLQDQAESPFTFRLAAPGTHGLALQYDSRQPDQNAFPFDERVLDDPRIPAKHLWEFAHGGLLGIS